MTNLEETKGLDVVSFIKGEAVIDSRWDYKEVSR
jgi:hypothetical protein